jgi:sialic acid synthase SpsE
MIILDFGSGNTCKNDYSYVKRMVDELKAIDPGRDIVIKWQLFLSAGENIPLDRKIFNLAYKYAEKQGYRTAASVFDLDSLKYLLQYDIPFVKLANNKSVYCLEGDVPRRIQIVKSVGTGWDLEPEYNMIKLACVSKYPATIEQYIDVYGNRRLEGISDHTTDFKLYQYYMPEHIEWHYKLEDSTGLDAGPFARTPKQLGGIL